MSNDFIISLKQSVVEAFASLYQHSLTQDEVKIENTNPSFEGSFTFVVFPFLRITKSKPEQSGEAIGSFIAAKHDEIKSFNVVKGFLNFELTDAFWLSYLSNLQTAKSPWSKNDFASKGNG